MIYTPVCEYEEVMDDDDDDEDVWNGLSKKDVGAEEDDENVLEEGITVLIAMEERRVA